MIDCATAEVYAWQDCYRFPQYWLLSTLLSADFTAWQEEKEWTATPRMLTFQLLSAHAKILPENTFLFYFTSFSQREITFLCQDPACLHTHNRNSLRVVHAHCTRKTKHSCWFAPQSISLPAAAAALSPNARFAMGTVPADYDTWCPLQHGDIDKTGRKLRP